MPGGRLQVCEPPLWIASVNQREWNSLDAEERSTQFGPRRRNTVSNWRDTQTSGIETLLKGEPFSHGIDGRALVGTTAIRKFREVNWRSVHGRETPDWPPDY